MYRDIKCNICGRILWENKEICFSCKVWSDSIIMAHNYKISKSLVSISEGIEYLLPALENIKGGYNIFTKQVQVRLNSISRIRYILERAQREIINLTEL